MISSWNVKVYHQLYEACSASRCCMKHINFLIHSLSSHLCQHPVHVKRHARETESMERIWGGDEYKVKEEKGKKASLHYFVIEMNYLSMFIYFLCFMIYKKWKHFHFFFVLYISVFLLEENFILRNWGMLINFTTFLWAFFN